MSVSPAGACPAVSSLLPGCRPWETYSKGTLITEAPGSESKWEREREHVCERFTSQARSEILVRCVYVGLVPVRLQ